MKYLPGFFPFLLVFSIGASGQSLFTNVNANLQPLGFSSCAWGDYDQDGDLDLVLAGEPGSTIPTVRVYQNNNGIFAPVTGSFTGLSAGSLEWGDCDGDGDLDLLISGRDDLDSALTLIYRNDNGNFVNSGAVLPGITDGQVAWGDVDNDGDLDILMSGRHDGLHYYTLILRNDGNFQFTDLGEHFPGLQSASVAWVDYNNDGKLDVMISGDSGGGMITRLYKQDGNTFTEVNPGGFKGLGAGNLRWGDLDNDGDMDLVLAGHDLYLDGYILLYENNGNDTFTEYYTLNNNISFTSIDLGDYNNDGWLDIILSGKVVGCGGTAATMLFRNESFLNFSEISTLIPGYKQGEVRWGDFNNDGYPDLLFTGFDGYDVPKTNLYKNDAGSGIFTVNTPPDMPNGLTATTSGSSVTVSWNRATDGQTPPEGLSYNVYIGTMSAMPDVVSPNADPLSGARQVASLGNTSQDTSWVISGLEDGTYFWSVQAIDNGFTGSSFSSEGTFTIDLVGINDQPRSAGIVLYPDPATDVLQVRIPATHTPSCTHGSHSINILNSAGQGVFQSVFSGDSYLLDVSGFASGIYLIRISNGCEKYVSRFSRN